MQRSLHQHHRQHRRRGVLTVELVASAVIVGLVAMMILPCLQWIRLQHRSSVEHAEALAAVTNALEEAATLPWETLSTDGRLPLETPEWITEQLSGSELTVTAAATDDGRKLTALLRWEPARGGPAERIELSSWVFEPEEAGP